MKRMAIACIIIFGLAAMAAIFPQIEIRYDHAGLTQITISKNTLIYVTLTLRTNPVTVRQDITGYDRHEAVTQIAQDDKNALVTWIQANEWKRIARSHPSSNPLSYGTAFRSLLDIKLSGVHYQASWDDTSDCPELRKAIGELEVICKQIVKKGKTSVESTRVQDSLTGTDSKQ